MPGVPYKGSSSRIHSPTTIWRYRLGSIKEIKVIATDSLEYRLTGDRHLCFARELAIIVKTLAREVEQDVYELSGQYMKAY